MADGLLRKKVSSMNLQIKVDSAGTSSLHKGEAPDHRMREIARKLGTPIDDLRSRPFVVDDFDSFDLIYAMDESNRRNILSLARNDTDRNKVFLLLNELEPGKDLEVPDPYYGVKQDFIDVYHILDRATDRVIERISNHG
jgi:protein-tyrosine phosphatase